MNAFELELDHERALLQLRFRGDVTPGHLAAQSQRGADMVRQLQPGFTVLVDLTDLQTMDLDCVPFITRLMDQFYHAHVGRVVRVIPDPDKDIGFTLLSYTHYRGRVPFETFESLQEANAALQRS